MTRQDRSLISIGVIASIIFATYKTGAVGILIAGILLFTLFILSKLDKLYLTSRIIIITAWIYGIFIEGSFIPISIAITFVVCYMKHALTKGK